jgi:Mn-dependent DtxR family transcriptional regulator
MTFDANVLRALLRLARRREAAAVDSVAVRVSGTPAQVRASMRRLRSGGLVEMRATGEVRLTMAGLAVAIALLPPAPLARQPSSRRASRAA